MSMTLEQEQLVRNDWRLLEPHAEAAARLFYDRLFELHPDSRVLFAAADMPAQGRKLMDMVGAIVRCLDTPLEAVSAVAALGRRHVGYGVAERDYDSVGAALLWTLEQVLGQDFGPDGREAWTAAYLRTSAIMRRAADRTTGEHQAQPPIR
jgi:hemoglobin-like flavoprotein